MVYFRSAPFRPPAPLQLQRQTASHGVVGRSAQSAWRGEELRVRAARVPIVFSAPAGLAVVALARRARMLVALVFACVPLMVMVVAVAVVVVVVVWRRRRRLRRRLRRRRWIANGTDAAAAEEAAERATMVGAVAPCRRRVAHADIRHAQRDEWCACPCIAQSARSNVCVCV